MTESVSALDRKIIRCMQDEPRASYAKIARQTGASEATIRRRITALTESGMIKTAILPNTLPLGYNVQAYVGIKTEPAYTHGIATALSELPEIMSVAETVGRWDIVAYCAAATIEDLTSFLSASIAPLRGVRELEPVIAANFLKSFSQWRVPLEGEERPDHQLGGRDRLLS